jgi:hypothetical protein
MKRTGSNAVIPVTVIAGLLLFALTAYAVAYVNLGVAIDAAPKLTFRNFTQRWQLTFFAPAGRVESLLTAKRVHLTNEFEIHVRQSNDG